MIVDARPSKRYRNGHLRGAESLYWQNALVSEKEPLLKSPEQIRQLFAAAGVTGNKKGRLVLRSRPASFLHLYAGAISGLRHRDVRRLLQRMERC